ncbi:TetR/AcrR family transcriptional regulator [Mycobacterium yunnanensis]|uniref:TetR/AcrR family transcriptional regulator n=1 Tax=Mycobacterium yunnanensis TaxID=368477 RepID=A0A9X2Z112_9MYCO|nr:TetR/AcrR family transcriptional regulator [Mycobacterium yunnanensis]MCV7420926.1 TetR/AcrR family transcriptional regulator [Mycobacterium yunnanensis]
MADVRPYRGVQARDRVAERRRRLLDAGLELLGGSESPPELTVRAVCSEAAITARYFYESFTDKDALVAAVFDQVVADIAATTQAAVAAAPPEEQNRAGIANLVGAVADDARVGRLLFNPRLTNAVLARKRSEAGGFFALLSGEHATSAHALPDDDWTTAAAHFIVGGVAQTISAWVSGDVALSQAQLVSHLTRMLDLLAPSNRESAGQRAILK